VRFNREPDTQPIGQQWEVALDNPPPGINFAEEAKRLLEYLKLELRATEVFGPVFDSKTLDVIAKNVPISTEQSSTICVQLDALAGLVTTGFADLMRTFEQTALRVRDQIIDYTSLIVGKTDSFVGRQFVFDEVERFINTNPRGYFFIGGGPGIGKTALAAQMVKINGYVHHFNIRTQGINSVDAFLRNICAQLIAKYQLDNTDLPP
jgi:hypothetical protein